MPDKRESRTRKEPVASYPETAVLSSRQVCEALGISQHRMGGTGAVEPGALIGPGPEVLEAKSSNGEIVHLFGIASDWREWSDEKLFAAIETEHKKRNA